MQLNIVFRTPAIPRNNPIPIKHIKHPPSFNIVLNTKKHWFFIIKRIINLGFLPKYND